MPYNAAAIAIILQLLFAQQIDQNGLPIGGAQPAGLPPPTSLGGGGPGSLQLNLVLEDGTPLPWKPAMSGSCMNVVFMRDGLIDLAGPCRITFRVPGFQPETVEVGRADHPVNVVIRRIGAEGPPLLYGTVNVALLRISKPARSKYAAGQAAMGLGHWAEAEQRFREAVAIYAPYSPAWDELGLALEQQHRTADARAAFETALAKDASFARSRVHLAGIAIAENDFARAAELTGQALRLGVDGWARAWFYDAVASLALNRPSRAESSARAAIKADTAHAFPRAEYILGSALAQRGERAEAIDHLKACLELDRTGSSADEARRLLSRLEGRD